MDRIGANFYRCVDMINDRLGAKPLVTQLPLGIEDSFIGIIDLVRMQAVVWDDDSLGANFSVKEIPADMAKEAKSYHDKLVEMTAEQDDDVLESYLAGEEISPENLISCIRKGVIKGSFVPVLCGSAFKNKGVQPLLDAVVDYLPSPLDIKSIHGIDPDDKEKVIECSSSIDEPFAALAFKVMNDPYVGSLTFVRIYSGELNSGTGVITTVKDSKERIGRILLMHANSREDIKYAKAGDIVALAGLKGTTTGDTLSAVERPVILERMEFPDPVIEVAVEPKSSADQEKMGLALSRLCAEDPSLHASVDEESGQTVLKGMGELHLEIIIDRMRREFKVEANIGAPQVAYRETITRLAEIDYTHKKQTGGAGQFARVKIIFEPAEPGTGFTFVTKIVGGAIPKEFIPGVEKGLIAQKETGVVASFPMIDFKATLVDGAFHDVDSSVLAFEIAAKAAFREGMAKAAPRLLEPIMKVEVITPEEYMGDVIGDINSRRGQINGMEARGNAQVISATVPLEEMFGYVNDLRSMSQGRAQYTMLFSHYAQVPQHVADKVKTKVS
jgi:elongation factor G